MGAGFKFATSTAKKWISRNSEDTFKFIFTEMAQN